MAESRIDVLNALRRDVRAFKRRVGRARQMADIEASLSNSGRRTMIERAFASLEDQVSRLESRVAAVEQAPGVTAPGTST